MELKITTLSQEPVNQIPIDKHKSFIKGIVPDYGTFSLIKLFEHACELLSLIGHGVVMEGNRKLTGWLQTFGGHCILTQQTDNCYVNACAMLQDQ